MTNPGSVVMDRKVPAEGATNPRSIREMRLGDTPHGAPSLAGQFLDAPSQFEAFYRAFRDSLAMRAAAILRTAPCRAAVTLDFVLFGRFGG